MQRTPNKEYFRCCIMTRQYRSEKKKNGILYCVGLCRTQQLLKQTDKSALIKKRFVYTVARIPQIGYVKYAEGSAEYFLFHFI